MLNGLWQNVVSASCKVVFSYTALPTQQDKYYSLWSMSQWHRCRTVHVIITINGKISKTETLFMKLGRFLTISLWATRLENVTMLTVAKQTNSRFQNLKPTHPGFPYAFFSRNKCNDMPATSLIFDNYRNESKHIQLEQNKRNGKSGAILLSNCKAKKNAMLSLIIVSLVKTRPQTNELLKSSDFCTS